MAGPEHQREPKEPSEFCLWEALVVPKTVRLAVPGARSFNRPPRITQPEFGKKRGKFAQCRTTIKVVYLLLIGKLRRPMKPLFAAILFSAATAAMAQPLPEGVPEAPPLPPPSYQGETVEPEVTIIETERGTVYEYRVHGQLYMVRVKPVVGPPYYFLDSNGNGVLDVNERHEVNTAVQQWQLFSW